MINDSLPVFEDIQAAMERTSEYAHQTPVLTSRKVNERANVSLFFKCENFQRVGAFKFRGALNAILQLHENDAKNGVATHSSGNHAQAVALAARLRGIMAHIVMPENSPQVKVNAVQDYGAEVHFCESTLEAREATLEKVVEQTGAHFIHPYNDPRIIAGQGTAALEFLTTHPDLDMILAPVGGGGLISGTAIAAKHINPEIITIGTEPEQANDAWESFHSGKLVPVKNPDTIADGLRTSLGPLTFKAIRQNVDDIVTVSESSIVDAMRFIWERMKIIVEPSCAVPLAAIFEHKVKLKGRKAGIIISGGNVDLDALPWNEVEG